MNTTVYREDINTSKYSVHAGHQTLYGSVPRGDGGVTGGAISYRRLTLAGVTNQVTCVALKDGHPRSKVFKAYWTLHNDRPSGQIGRHRDKHVLH